MVTLLVSIDTEEDNWTPSREGITVENIRELPTLQALFDRLGIRATYFTTYQVAKQRAAATIVREICADGRAELGAHLHPWNTQPLDEPLVPHNTMLKNLPAKLQLRKVQCLTDTLGEAFGAAPTTFRAGRWGLGPTTVRALIECGYRVDSSVIPYVSWEETDGGPSFMGAPLEIYRLDGRSDVRQSARDGPVVEVPVSAGYSRWPFSFWGRFHAMLEASPGRHLRLAGIASRSRVLRKIILSPEISSVRDMLTLSRLLVSHGQRHLHLCFHCPSLRPGLTPFVANAADVERLYASIEQYMEGLAALCSVRYATVGEAGATLSPPL